MEWDPSNIERKYEQLNKAYTESISKMLGDGCSLDALSAVELKQLIV